jgi:hypothetical protein
MQSLLDTEQIERSTAAIRRALSGLQPGTRIVLDDVFAAFIEVRHVTEMRLAMQLIASPFVNPGSALNRALTEYRTALVEWDRHLPRLHGWLVAERARLGSRRVHIESVQSWVETDRQTREPRSTR